MAGYCPARAIFATGVLGTAFRHEERIKAREKKNVKHAHSFEAWDADGRSFERGTRRGAKEWGEDELIQRSALRHRVVSWALQPGH